MTRVKSIHTVKMLEGWRDNGVDKFSLRISGLSKDIGEKS